MLYIQEITDQYVGMYIDRVPNRNSPPAILLRESYRQGGKVRKRTIANLSKWPEHLVEGLRVLLGGGTAVERLEEVLEVVRSRPHGHVAAVLGTLRKLGLDRLLDRTPSRTRDLVCALIVARVLEPRSKLATARSLSAETASSSLGQVLGLGEVDEEELYDALDWLDGRQQTIERRLARRQLAEERARKREALLQATEAELDKIVQATRRDKWRLKGKDKIALRVGKIIGKHKMSKHFHLEIGEDRFGCERDAAGIAKNQIQPRLPEAKPFETVTRPTPGQQRALDLLEMRLERTR